MTEKRFTIIQDGDYFTVIDNLKNKSMGMFEFKEDEFPVYFCFHKIIDLLNELAEENEQLKQLIKKTLETTPIEHTLAVELKNSVRELYD